MAAVKQGMKTANNDKYLRLWYEVGVSRIAFPECQKNGTEQIKWVPYLKGGEFRKWSGNTEYVINWEEDGRALRAEQRAVLRNIQFSFKENLSWSVISSGRLAVRYVSPGFMFDGTGSCLFAVSNELVFLQAFLNSSAGMAFASFLSPTLTFEIGQIASYPIIRSEAYESSVGRLVSSLRNLSKLDWDAQETSWGFARHSML